MDKLKLEVLNEQARINGFSNWEAFKGSIRIEQANFIEACVLKAIKKMISKLCPDGQFSISGFLD